MHPGRLQTPEPSVERLFSIEALRRAWQQVRRSGKSPGSDGVTPEQFETNLNTELNRLRQRLINGSYLPSPVRRYYIKKASGKERPISIWAIRDRVVQRVVADYLTPIVEPMFLDCSYGFRPGRSVEDAVKEVIRYRDCDHRWLLDTDIQDCFGSIDLKLLMDQVENIVPGTVVPYVIGQWLKTPVESQPGKIAGVSQGGVISPLLANLYLHRFDQMMVAALPQSKLVRFADDFVVLSRTDTEASWSMDVTRRSLENLRLSMNLRKTRITHFDEGFIFLGAAFKGNTCGYRAKTDLTLQEE